MKPLVVYVRTPSLSKYLTVSGCPFRQTADFVLEVVHSSPIASLCHSHVKMLFRLMLYNLSQSASGNAEWHGNLE